MSEGRNKWFVFGHDGNAYEIVLNVDGMRTAIYRGFPDYARNRFILYIKKVLVSGAKLPDIRYINFEDTKKM